MKRFYPTFFYPVTYPVTYSVIYLAILHFSLTLFFWLTGAFVPLNFPAFAQGNLPEINLSQEILLDQGIKSITSQDYSQALERLNQVIQQNPTWVEAYGHRCWVWIQLEQYSEAASDCAQAVQLASNRSSDYLNLGLAHYRQGNFAEAIAANNQAIQLQPDSIEAYYNRGLAYFELKAYSEAVADYDQALDQRRYLTQSEEAEIYIDRGVAKLMLKQMSNAMADLSQAIQLDGSSSRAYYNHGCLCRQMKNNQIAVQDFDIALQLNPHHAQAYFNRALLRYEQGLYAGAMADLRSASHCFQQQGNQAACEHALKLIQRVQQELLASSSLTFG
ncbi:MAG: tetratricopeptide repeat protein [Microcoleaceae cyanobacterium]